MWTAPQSTFILKKTGESMKTWGDLSTVLILFLPSRLTHKQWDDANWFNWLRVGVRGVGYLMATRNVLWLLPQSVRNNYWLMSFCTKTRLEPEHFYFFLIEERNFTKTHLNITQYMYPLLITSLPICTFLHLKLDIDYKLQALFYTFVTGKVQSHKL